MSNKKEKANLKLGSFRIKVDYSIYKNIKPQNYSNRFTYVTYLNVGQIFLTRD